MYQDYDSDCQEPRSYSAADEAAFLATEQAAEDAGRNAAAESETERERMAAVAGRYCLRCHRHEGGYTRFTTAPQTGICDDCL